MKALKDTINAEMHFCAPPFWTAALLPRPRPLAHLLPSLSPSFPCFVPLARNLETLATEAKFYFLFCCVSSAKVKNGHRCFGKPEGFQDATNVFPTK